MAKTNVKRGFDLSLTLGDTVLAKAQDVEYTLSTEFDDTSVKEDGIWEDDIAVSKRLEGNADVLVCDDNGVSALLEAYEDDTSIAFSFETGIDGKTLSGNCRIGNIGSPQGLREALVTNIDFASRGEVSGLSDT